MATRYADWYKGETRERMREHTASFRDRLLLLKATMPGADRTGTWTNEAKRRGLVK
jgi:hypothetical protein